MKIPLRTRRILPPVLLSLAALLSGCDGGEPAAEKEGPLQRLAQELDRQGRSGHPLSFEVVRQGQKEQCCVRRANPATLQLEVKEEKRELAWQQLSPGEFAQIAVALGQQDPRWLILGGEVGIELGLLDVAGDLLTRAHEQDPALLSQAQSLVQSLSPLSGSPLGDLERKDLPTVDLSEVRQDHPRLFFRSQPWGAEGQGLTLATLRVRATKEPWQGFVAELKGSPKGAAGLALHYLLREDEDSARKAGALLQQHYNTEGNSLDGVVLEDAALAFDWLANWPAFGAQRREVAGRLASAAEKLMRRLEIGAHIYHTRMYTWATAIAITGLALAGEDPRAQRLLTFGYRYWMTRLAPALRWQGGAWHSGFGYGRKYTVRSAFQFLSVWPSATGRDLWKEVELHQDDWARAMAYFLIYTLRSNGTHPPFGDDFYSQGRPYDFGLCLQMSALTGDPYANELALSMLERQGQPATRVQRGESFYKTYCGYYPLLFLDPGRPRQPLNALPGARAFGPQSMGCAVIRAGWGPKDPWIFFKCGDYFDNHGHFDQGHFEIFRSRPLLLDSGAYDGFNSVHRLEYYHQTIAHNSIQILDPKDPQDSGNQRVFTYQVAGNLTAYQARTECDTGELTEFRQTPEYTLVRGDLSKAYPPQRARRVLRTLAFIGSKHLLVYDQVELARPGLETQVLFHYPTRVAMEGATFRIENETSCLLGQVLLPRHAQLSEVPQFQVGGQDLGPKGKVNPIKAGAGRLEIRSPDKQAAHFTHLTIFQIDEAGAIRIPVSLQESPEGLTLELDKKRIFINQDWINIRITDLK